MKNNDILSAKDVDYCEPWCLDRHVAQIANESRDVRTIRLHEARQR